MSQPAQGQPAKKPNVLDELAHLWARAFDLFGQVNSLRVFADLFVSSIFSVFVIPILVWYLILRFSSISEDSPQAKMLLYLILVADVLLFTYSVRWVAKKVLGRRFTLTKEIQVKFDKWSISIGNYDKLLNLLDPKLVSLYIYAILALTYMIFNIERFAGLTLFSSNKQDLISVWQVYRDVVLEVLLTYVAIDAALDKWLDWRSKASR
ncbi:MAG TPA: hypothetical protein VEX13_00615 [Chloroflexia bacterium]|nr:hypothetical protein [Chloroflexia bacterium]